MTPLEAWSVISKNLAELYRMRNASGGNGNRPEDTEAEVIAFTALKELQERIAPKPLSFQELKEMEDKPVWVQYGSDPENDKWAVLECASDIFGEQYVFFWDIPGHEEYGKDMVCYRHKPQEVRCVQGDR